MFERMKYMRLLTTTLAFSLTAPLFAAELGNPSSEMKSSVVTHEWGTFTSVAGADGDPVRWDALTGPPELPCFVNVRHVVTKSGVVGTGPHGNAGAVFLFQPAHEAFGGRAVSAG